MSSLRYFLRWDLECFGSHVNLLVHVNTRDDEEYPGAPGPPRQEAAESEDDGSLVLLDHLHRGHQGAGEGQQDQQEGEESYQERTDICSLVKS